MSKIEAITGVTSTGFEYEVTKSRMENYELVEALGEMEDNPLALTKVVKLLLGEQAKALKDHVRQEDGTVPTEALLGEVKEIFEDQKLKK